MRKVTKRLLTVGAAILAFGACQDSVIVTTPEPPPPPPPPPAIDATVSILGLDLIPGPGSANPTAIAGDINVSLNVEEGDNVITAIDLLLNGSAVGCETISTNTVGVGVSASSAGADVVECFWNTDDLAAACDGNNIPPAFPNGTHTLGAQITLDDGTTRTASNTQQVTLVNSSFIQVAHVAGGQGIIGANGRLYHGGPADLDGDGTDDNIIQFGVCPVSYNGTDVGTVSAVGASTGGGTDADFGSGAGAVHTLSATPFLFEVDPTDNTTLEDDAIIGTGHTVTSTGSIFDADGLNVTTEFAHGTLGMFYMDLQAPLVAAGAEITINGASTTVSHYSDEATNGFGVTMVTDAGVGFTFGSGAGSTIAVGDCAVAANMDGSFATAFVPITGFEDVSAVTDLTEDDELIDADTNAADAYCPEVTNLQDDLGNVTDLSAPMGGLPADATINSLTNWGADFTEAPISALMPGTDPADAPKYVLNDVQVDFDAADPNLASGDAGSQVDETGCTFAFGGAGCTNVTASQGTTTYEVDELGGAGDGTFSVDLTDIAGGGASPLADGEHTITVDVNDLAVPANPSTDDFTFILDTTFPDIKPFTDFESDATLSGSAAIFGLAGQVVDGDGTPDSGEGSTIATLTVGIFTDAGGDCGSTVPADITPLTEGAGAGEVDNQTRSIADTDGGEADFTQNSTEDYNFASDFLVQNPGAGAVSYCMIVNASDSALDRTGAGAANSGASYNRFTITWQ